MKILLTLVSLMITGVLFAAEGGIEEKELEGSPSENWAHRISLQMLRRNSHGVGVHFVAILEGKNGELLRESLHLYPVSKIGCGYPLDDGFIYHVREGDEASTDLKHVRAFFISQEGTRELVKGKILPVRKYYWIFSSDGEYCIPFVTQNPKDAHGWKRVLVHERVGCKFAPQYSAYIATGTIKMFLQNEGSAVEEVIFYADGSLLQTPSLAIEAPALPPVEATPALPTVCKTLLSRWSSLLWWSKASGEPRE